MAKKLNQDAQSDLLKPTESRVEGAAQTAALSNENGSAELLFGKNNYRFMLIGLGLVILGFILMSGGAMPDANTWDEGIIYSFTRITLAPIVILTGLAIEVYAIFAKK
jgi:Protein of unknown function (DUF3098)